MRRREVYTLLDGSNHETRAAAIAHCDEMIGAELRPVLSFRPGTTLEEMTRAIVKRGEFHSEIVAAAAWIAERAEVMKSEND